MVRGSPIRKSSDHSLVIDSPRLIADSYVLLRFLVPRHPPYALKNLHKKNFTEHYRCFASTMQFSNNTQHHHHPHQPRPTSPDHSVQPAHGLPTQKKQTPTTTTTHQGAVPVAEDRSFRTQQRADTPHPATTPNTFPQPPAQHP